MSDEKPNVEVSAPGGGFFWIGLFAMLIACMHYGYSCNACGCDLVDSNVPLVQEVIK